MHTISHKDIQALPLPNEDEYLFGWDPTPGIVSVWANREGQAIIWQRVGEHTVSCRERFRPWLFATSLQDLAQLGSRLMRSFDSDGDTSTFTYLELNGPTRILPLSHFCQ